MNLKKVTVSIGILALVLVSVWEWVGLKTGVEAATRLSVGTVSLALSAILAIALIVWGLTHDG